MKHTLTFFDKFINSFREFFIHHHSSLEFRAKIYTLPIAVNVEDDNENGNCEFDKLDSIVEEIYPDSLRRQNTLILTIKEYVEKVQEPNGLGIDELIIEIERSLKITKRYAKKINLEHIKLLASCTKEKEAKIYQQRIFQYLENLKSNHI